MFKNMKLATKIITGFALVLVFLAVVGLTGYLSLNKTVDQMKAISEQLEIAKNVNDCLALSQDSQAGSLRFIIYQDDSYLEGSQQASRDAIKAVEEARGRMQSEENRRNADAVTDSIKAYMAANAEYATLAENKVQAGNVRAEAAGKTLEGIRKLITRREQFLTEQSKDSDDGKVTDYEAVELTLLAQKARDAFNRTQICAQQYQLAITPEQQDAMAKEWVDEIQSTQKAVG